MPLAITVTEQGSPNVLQPQEVPLPAPAAGEVRIRHQAIGVNFVDVYLRNGTYPLARRPAVLGFEGAGMVDAVGDGVTGFAPGERVAYLGGPPGAYAEMRVLPAARLLRLPDAIDARTAGSSMLRGLTAHMLLHKVHRLEPGQWVLVHAAAGGLGQLITRWARRLGGRVIGTVGSEAKVEAARSAGAEAVLLHRSEDWAEQVRRIADGRGVHLAVDGIGGAMLARTFGTVRQFGVVASIGQPAGPIPPVRVEELSSPRVIALARPSVLAYADDIELYRRGASDLLAALADGLVNPIGAEFALRDAAKAHEALETGRTTGSVVLRA